MLRLSNPGVFERRSAIYSNICDGYPLPHAAGARCVCVYPRDPTDTDPFQDIEPAWNSFKGLANNLLADPWMNSDISLSYLTLLTAAASKCEQWRGLTFVVPSQPQVLIFR